ncbi:MAG: GIY-YIG nuclease family protein [Ignavibacteriota bacterium]
MSSMKNYFVYMMANKHRTTIYTGVTHDLQRRVSEHKEKKFDGFSKRYNLDFRVYYEEFYDVHQAIAREKQIKGGSREKKEILIAKMNPTWKDLALELL